jgi:hypothetical protein
MRSSLLKSRLRDGNCSSVVTSLKGRSAIYQATHTDVNHRFIKEVVHERGDSRRNHQVVRRRKGFGSYLLYRLVPAKADPVVSVSAGRALAPVLIGEVESAAWREMKRWETG